MEIYPLKHQMIKNPQRDKKHYNNAASRMSMGVSIQSQRKLRLSLIFAAAGGIISLGWLFTIPKEGGLSAIRLGMIVLLGLGVLVPLVGLTSKVLNRLSTRYETLNVDSVTNRRGIFWLGLIAVNGVYLLLLAPEAQDIVAQAMLTRLSPLIFFLTVLSILGTFLLLPSQLPTIRTSISQQVLVLTSVIFVGLLLGWGLIWLTKWGVTPEVVGFNAMGIPILEVYMFLAWISVLLVGKVLNLWRTRQPQGKFSWRLDALFIICLYFLAAILWRNTPAPYNWFVTQPYPPNQQPYPSSDALRYDTTAQSVLIGEGLKTENSLRTLRPLYTGMLSILHAIGGPDYQPIIELQPFILAIFPVLLYLLGLHLHSRMAGLFLALLILFREQTAIELSDRITISHAKLLMADLPTAVVLSGFILLVVIWLKTNKPSWKMALFSGGALGAVMLIRYESLLLIAVVGIIALLKWRKHFSVGVRQFIIFGFGILLITTPWVYRNWQRHGILFFDSPDGRLTAVIERAVAVPPTIPKPTSTLIDHATEAVQENLPTETLTESKPEITKTPNEAFEKAVTIISDSPQVVILSIFNHYLNSEIQSVLAMPTSFRLPDSLINFFYHRDFNRFWHSCCQAIGYFERMPYWQSWGELPKQAILPLIGNLFLISAGTAVAYRRLKWVGLFPLMAHMAFLAGIAIFRTSGGRYILPVNWLLVVYYALGVIAVTIWGGKLLGWMRMQPGWNTAARTDRSTLTVWFNNQWVDVLVPVIGLLLLGCVLPIYESAFPQRYTQKAYQNTYSVVEQALSPDEQDWLNNWLTMESAAIRFGQALYPRFLEAGSGEPDKDPSVMERDYNRLTFSLIGPYNLRVHLPLTELETGFPNGEDVFVVGCLYQDDQREVLDAKFVARLENSTVQEILWRDINPPTGCLP
jgi:hypothetical protein